jgi:hypothetical protein
MTSVRVKIVRKGQIKLRVQRKAVVKLKVIPQFPSSVAGDKFITVTKANGNYTIDVDYTLLANTPIVDPTTAMIAVDDLSSGSYKVVSLASLLTSGLDADLQAIAALTGTGILSRTADGVWALRTMQAPAAGLTITNPGGVAGNETFALANDLAALEGLASTGIAVRTATDTWAQRTITGTANRVSITNGDGVSGNPTADIAATYVGQTSITTLGTIGTGVWQATKVALAYGGTNADLSATGGTAQYLKQSSTGAAVTVGTIPASDIASPAALTRTNDTNVTATLGGSPTTALLAATSITLGWTGTLAPVRGGFGADISASSGVPLFASGVPTFTGTTGTSTFVRSSGPSITGGLGVAGGLNVSTGGASISGGLISIGSTDLQQELKLSGSVSPTQLTTNTNDWAVTGLASASTVRFSTNASRSITGLAGGADGKIVILHNIGSFDAVFANEDTSSTAANRFSIGASTTVSAGTSITLRYDATSSRWRSVASAGGGGGGGSGTVTSVAFSAGNGISLSGTNPITTSGTVTITNSGVNRVVEQFFTSSGTYTPTSGMLYCIVELQGSGGGGGGVTSNASGITIASGGGGGAYLRKILTAAQIGASQSVTIPSGGSGASAGNNAGSNGSACSLGTLLSVSGGSGAGGASSAGATSPGGAPGTTGSGSLVSGALVIPGSVGGGGSSSGSTSFVSQIAYGGSAPWGGGLYVLLNSTALTGAGYGAGGSPGGVFQSGTAQGGGAGAPGAARITEFCS